MKTNHLTRSAALLLALVILTGIALPSCTEQVVAPYKEPANRLVVERVVPTYGSPGDIVAIMGRSFGDTNELSVRFGSRPATIESILFDRVYVRIPEGAGDTVYIERRDNSSSASTGERFTVIPSPHRYNRWSIAFENMPGRTAWQRLSESGDTTSRIQTHSVAFNLARQRAFVPAFNGCPETFSTGDTVRICTQEHRLSTGPSDWDRSSATERYELDAIVDTVRGMLTRVSLRMTELVVEDHGSQGSAVRRYTREITVRDLPYVIVDGELIATIEGAALAANVEHLRVLTIEEIDRAEGWYRTREEVLSIDPAASSRIVVRLIRRVD